METIEVSSAHVAISLFGAGSGGYWRAQAHVVAVDPVQWDVLDM